jgi:hypothetical protein
MAIRYYAQFEDLHGTEFAVNIYDSDYTGTSPFQFNVGAEGFRLEYEMQDKFERIVPSTVIVPMVLQNNNDAALLTNLVSSVEGRYMLEIRSGGTTYNDGHVYWRGIILPEFIEVEDEAYPQMVEIRAMDDLSNLRAIDYLQDPEGTGYAYTKGHIANCMNLLRQWSITADSDRFLFVDALEVYDNDAVWYAGHQMQLNFATFKDNAPVPPTYWTAYEVLDEILLALGCRIYWRPSIDTDVKSIFVIDSWVMHAHDDEDFTGYTVTSNGTLSAQQVHARPQFNLDSTGINRLRGWRHGYLPSIREVRRDFDYLGTNPFTIDHVIDQVDADGYFDASLVFNDAPELHFGEGTPVAIRFRLKFTIAPDATPISIAGFRMQVMVNLHIGQYYANRGWTQAENNLPYTNSEGSNQYLFAFTYDPAEWSTSAGTMHFFSPGFDLYLGGTFEMDCAVDLPPLPADMTSNAFEVDIISQLIRVGGLTQTPSAHQYANTVTEMLITNLSIYPASIFEMDGSTVIFKAVNSSTGGRYKLELPTAKISDLVDGRGGGIFVLPVGGDRFQPSKWRSLADTSVELNLHNVICRDWMKSQPANIRRMVGTIYDHRSAPDQCMSPFATFTHNTVPYAAVAMTYIAGQNLYDVELVELEYGGTVTTPAVAFEDGIAPTPYTPPAIASAFTDAENASGINAGVIDSVVPLRDGIVSLVADQDNFVSVGDTTFEVNVGTIKVLEADDVSATFNVPVTIDLQGETFEVLNAGFPNPLTVTTDSVEAMDLSIINSSGAAPGSLSFFEASDNGGNSIVFRAPTSLSVATSYTLPAADGSNGDVLETNGSGVLSFASFGTKVENAISNAVLSTVDAQGAITSETGFEAKTNAYIKFFELGSNGTNNITIKAPTALGGNTTYILPATDGTSGQSLKTDGAGNLYWG